MSKTSRRFKRTRSPAAWDRLDERRHAEMMRAIDRNVARLANDLPVLFFHQGKLLRIFPDTEREEVEIDWSKLRRDKLLAPLGY